MRYIITISREFGSGGGEIGKRTAEKLEIPFYDKSVTEFTAVKSGFSTEVIKSAEDKTPGLFAYGMYSYNVLTPVHDEIFFAQSKVVREIAARGPSVIVGRCADYVLSDKTNVLNVFVHAPMEERIKRICRMYSLDAQKADKIIRQNDKARSKYHDHYASLKWGATRNYHLTINSTVGIENAADTICSLAKSLSGI